MGTVLEHFAIHLAKKVERMDVSDVEDGVVVNLHPFEDRMGDLGIDNKKKLYRHSGKAWVAQNE